MVRVPIVLRAGAAGIAWCRARAGPRRIRASRRAPTTRAASSSRARALRRGAGAVQIRIREEPPLRRALQHRPGADGAGPTDRGDRGADEVPARRRRPGPAQPARAGAGADRAARGPARGAYGHHRSAGRAIRVDGRDVGRTPLYQPIRLAAGTHTVSITMEGITPIIRAIDLREGDRQVLAFVVPPAVVPKPAATASPAASLIATPPAAPPPDLRRWSYVTAGIGAAAGAAALGFYCSTGADTTTGRRRTPRCKRSRRAARPTTRQPPRTTRAPTRSRP